MTAAGNDDAGLHDFPGWSRPEQNRKRYFRWFFNVSDGFSPNAA